MTSHDRGDAQPELEGVPVGLVTIDASGTILYANTTLAEMLGRPIADFVGAHIDVLLPPASRIFFSTHLFPLLRVQRGAEEIYVPMAGADGAELPMLVNGRARERDAGDAFDLAVVPMRQRNELESELIAARNAAQEATAAKDRFLSVVSHELRSPLSGITGYAELLLRERKGPLTDEQRRYVERIHDTALYQASLIEDILDFATFGGSRALVPTVTSVEELLARAESILTVRAEQEARPLVRTPRPASGDVRVDPRAAQQVLLNLGTNALKYGEPGTAIRITADHDGRRVRIAVSDTGPGIPPDRLEAIFEPFVRFSSSADRGARQGVGLGLAISRDLARAMGGDITVESTLGEGSTFTFELPVR